MITSEPLLRVGILEGYKTVHGTFSGEFVGSDGTVCSGRWEARVEGGAIVMRSEGGKDLLRGPAIRLQPSSDSHFELEDVTIGVQFHWERKERQSFAGGLQILARVDGTLTVVNEIPLERYLESVISSEMSAEAPPELLKAHAITSRSWLVAMLEREHTVRAPATPVTSIPPDAASITRWYSREDHDLFDVCADDHCQRYQGITKIISPAVHGAINETRGKFLVFENQVCDARYYKSCGGLSDRYENSWEEIQVPYLESISCSDDDFPPILTEDQMAGWVMSEPPAFCNTRDTEILRKILPSFDQETTDFFRWTVSYERSELENIIRSKSGIEFGTLLDLQPIRRGPSGRLVELRIIGSRRTIIVGKDLEIRRWLSVSHLYSSAFIVRTDRGSDGIPRRFTLRGAGWGHGVGLCQIGAAVMAVRGRKADDICLHYFRGTTIQRLY